MFQIFVLLPLVLLAYSIAFFLLKNANKKARLRKEIIQLTGSVRSPSLTSPVLPALAEAKLIVALKKYDLHNGWEIAAHQTEPLTVSAKIQYRGNSSRIDYHDNRFNTGRQSTETYGTETKMTLEARITAMESGSKVSWIFATESRQSSTDELVTEDSQSEEIMLGTNQYILQEFGLLAKLENPNSIHKIGP